MKKIFSGDWARMVQTLYYERLAEGYEVGTEVPTTVQNNRAGGEFMVVFSREEANYKP